MAKLHLMGGKEDTLNFIKAIPEIDKLNNDFILEEFKSVCL